MSFSIFIFLIIFFELIMFYLDKKGFFSSSCNFECNQGRNCNCLTIAKDNIDFKSQTKEVPNPTEKC